MNKPKEWQEEHFGRLVEKTELIIEDITEEEILMVAGKMEKAGYYLEYYKCPKQKSGHLHIKNIKLPKDATIEQSNKYKELIIKKYLREDLWEKVDWNFYNRREDAEPHRIATENEEHYKGYGVKAFIRDWGTKKDNPFEEIEIKWLNSENIARLGGKEKIKKLIKARIIEKNYDLFVEEDQTFALAI